MLLPRFQFSNTFFASIDHQRKSNGPKKVNRYFRRPSVLIQGQSWQTGFFELALRDRNVQVRFFWMVPLKSWDLRNFASATSFCEIYTVRHLRSNLQTCKKNLGKKILNVTTVKLLLKNKIQCFWGFLMLFCFKLYLKVNIHPFHDFLLIIAWKWPLKLAIFQNSLRN